MSDAVVTSDLNSAVPRAVSITHRHILASVNTMLSDEQLRRPIRVLDLGCGDGELIAYLSLALPMLRSTCGIEMHGLDVADSGVQASGFFLKTRSLLESKVPETDWSDRLKLVTSTDAWPFPDDYFDVIVSNQVLEHVADHDIVFREIKRTLKPDQFSVHVFPLIHYLQEGHIHIPLAHRIKGHGLLKSYIKFMSRLGFGSYRGHQRAFGMTLDYYAEEHADYLTFMTNYLSAKEILAACKRSGLRADFRFTSQFYWSKLRSMMRRSEPYRYNAPRPWRDTMSFQLWKRVSSVTLVLEKKQIYAR